jgi:hypothetical protein
MGQCIEHLLALNRKQRLKRRSIRRVVHISNYNVFWGTLFTRLTYFRNNSEPLFKKFHCLLCDFEKSLIQIFHQCFNARQAISPNAIPL